MRLWILFCFILLLSVICRARLRADLNGDCRVDFADLYILMSEWVLEEDCEMSLGPELVTNGGFDTDTNWTKGAGWTISEGTANYITGVPPSELITQNISITEEKCYQVSFDLILYTTPHEQGQSITALIGAVPAQTWLLGGLSGTQTATAVAAGPSSVTIVCSNTLDVDLIKIDNVSVREVLPDGGGFIGQNIFEEME
jgi:hypothetical protein